MTRRVPYGAGVVDLSARSYQESDTAAVTDLFNLADVHAGGRAGYIASDTTAMVSTMVGDTTTDTTLRWAPDGSLAAVAMVLTPPTGGYRVDLPGAVHPRWRGDGLGRELLAWQLARAGELHRAAGSPDTWCVDASAVSTDQDALRLFRRFDLSPTRYWFDMVASTAEPPALDLPAGLRTVAYRPDLRSAVYAAHQDAFADHWGYQHRTAAEWIPLTIGSDSFLPELSVVAFDGDEPAGYVLSYSDADPARLYVGHVGVRRPWRRRGLAASLLAVVLADAGRAGMTTAGLGVDADSPTGAVGVYERVGFAVEYQEVTYSAPIAG